MNASCKYFKLLDHSEESVAARLNIAEGSSRKFEHGTIEEKKEILANLGSNLLLKDKIFSIQLESPFELLKNIPKDSMTEITTLEPAKVTMYREVVMEEHPESIKILRLMDNFRTCLIELIMSRQ